jgi:hypothetical protein
MSRDTANSFIHPILGAITSGGVGWLLLQSLGAIALGILGALGGWIANKYIIPKLNRLFSKNDKVS